MPSFTLKTHGDTMICSMEGCNCNAVKTPLFDKYYVLMPLCFELIMDDDMELSE